MQENNCPTFHQQSFPLLMSHISPANISLTHIPHFTNKHFSYSYTTFHQQTFLSHISPTNNSLTHISPYITDTQFTHPSPTTSHQHTIHVPISHTPHTTPTVTHSPQWVVHSPGERTFPVVCLDLSEACLAWHDAGNDDNSTKRMTHPDGDDKMQEMNFTAYKARFSKVADCTIWPLLIQK